MKDVTNIYENMIEAFECDFSLATDKHSLFSISKLQEKIELKDEKLLKDIELIKELSFKIRNNKIKLIEE